MRPYADDREHLLDHLRRLDRMCRRHLERWWAEHGGGGGDELGGLYVSDEEVARLLDPHPDRRPGSGPSPGRDDGVEWTPSGEWHPDDDPGLWGGFQFPDDDELAAQVAAATRELRERERATLSAGRELRLVALAERFDLDDRHRDALVVALAPELDRKYEKVYGYLQDDVTRTRPTVDLALRVCFPDETERLAARSLFVGDSPLVRHRLVHRDGDERTPVLSRPVRVDERIVEFLLGGDDVDDALAGIVEVVEPGPEPPDPSLPADVARRLDRVAGRLAEPASGRPPMVVLSGPYGAGRAAAVEAVCADAGTPVLRADAGRLDRDALRETVGLLGRECRLQDAVLHLTGLDELAASRPAEEEAEADDSLEAEAVLEALDPVPAPVFVSTTEAVSPRVQADLDGHEFVGVSHPVPSFERRLALWRAVDDLPDDVDPADLASKFRLTPGAIEDAVATARTLVDDGELAADAVYAGCRAQSRERLGSLARQVEPVYTWEDIVLPADAERALREVAVHVRHRGTVYSKWGFEEKYSLGNGLNVLFAGPSGTGKTMAAEIIAADAGLDLYRIDLSSVVSKYIGETEKNLRAVFDEAEDSNAILFFDEADAIFGERSEVSDSHDRYANVEVSYLLQRMEAHDGTVILASNLKENIDDAFVRRINLTVEFPMPERDSREAIWRSVFPDETPLGDVDFDFLASVELAGGNIKNAALTASFLAADDGGRVEMRHLVRAVERELRKTGRLVTPGSFGEYEALLDA